MHENEYFDKWFQKTAPIIYRFQHTYYIQLWDFDDWQQEARIILNQVLSENVAEDRIIQYFSVRFKSHILDSIRYQEAIKRQSNRAEYLTLDANVLKYNIPDNISVAETTICNETFQNFAIQLSPQELKDLKNIINSPTIRKNAKFNKLLKKLSNELYKED